MEMPHTEVPIDPDINELVPGFCAARKSEMKTLEEFFRNGDFESIKKISHTIKGIAAPYGFPTLGELFRNLEKSVVEKNADSAKEIFSNIQNYIERYC